MFSDELYIKTMIPSQIKNPWSVQVKEFPMAPGMPESDGIADLEKANADDDKISKKLIKSMNRCFVFASFLLQLDSIMYIIAADPRIERVLDRRESHNTIVATISI